MDLDSLIADAAPPVLADQAVVRRTLEEMIQDSRRASGRAARRRRAALVGALTIGAIGATAATTAAVVPSSWTSWITPDHKTCEMRLRVAPAGPDIGTGEPNMWPAHVDYARRGRMIEDATSFLNQFDYAGIDHAAALRAYQDQEAQLIKQQVATEGEGEAQPRLRGDSLTSAALSAWTVARLKAHLTADGYEMATTPGSDLFLMSLTSAWLCK